LPLSRYVIQHREFDTTPLILTTDQWSPMTLAEVGLRHSRIDCLLTKPFNMAQLLHAVEQAHYNRNSLRNCLVYLGRKNKQVIADAVFNSQLPSHWKTFANATNVTEFQNILQHHGFRIGTIICESSELDADLANALTKFKRETLGLQTPCWISSGQEVVAKNLRAVSQGYLMMPQSSESFQWEATIHMLSQRLQHKWMTNYFLLQGQELLAGKKIKKLSAIVEASLQLDPVRWETHELIGDMWLQRGDLKKAEEHFIQSLKTNPYSPLSHIRLLGLLTGVDREKFSEVSTKYCGDNAHILKAIQSSTGLERKVA